MLELLLALFELLHLSLVLDDLPPITLHLSSSLLALIILVIHHGLVPPDVVFDVEQFQLTLADALL